jgi:hypothetical protein
VRRSFDWGADLLGMLSPLRARRMPSEEALAEGVGFEPTIRFQVCTLFQWLVGSERLRRRPAGVALERGCDMFDDLFRGHFSER